MQRGPVNSGAPRTLVALSKQNTKVALRSSVAGFVATVTGVSFLGLWGAIVGFVAGELFRCALTILLARQIMRQNGLRLLGRARLGEAKILRRVGDEEGSGDMAERAPRNARG
jgi:hypothetical protein